VEITRIKKIKDKLLDSLGRKYVLLDKTKLPPKHLRFCGKEFGDDDYFPASAEKEARRLASFCGLSRSSKVLDVGCGPGRLPIGILRFLREVEKYRGVDVDRRAINWCSRHISEEHHAFQFVHLDVRNARYNPQGNGSLEDFKFPFKDGEVRYNLSFFSVFSHMTTEDVDMYLSEFCRMLSPEGKLFLTGFFEKGVPPMTINPNGYRDKWSGELHCVRYDIDFFKDLLYRNGFALERFDHAVEVDGQSSIYASKRLKYSPVDHNPENT
jgi:SAM-dependent methyltransferase